MDGLSTASSVIAVIQISSQVFDLCRTYYLNVKDARKDIQRLRNEITALQDVLVSVADLADDPKASSLKTLDLILKEDGPVKQCEAELMALAERLDPGEEKGKMRQFGLRALKWPFSAKEVDKILAAISRHKSTFTLALTTDQTALSLGIAQGVSDIAQQLDAQKLDGEREAIIQWLSTTDPSTNFHAACKKCQPGSGRWLLERAEFTQWQTTRNSFLWLHGIPGSGKTILSSIIVQKLQDQCQVRPKDALAYFYFDFNATVKQDLFHCLSSIVAQLCSHKKAFLSCPRKSFERSSYGKHRASIDEMKDMLFDITINLDNVFIIIDALDECPKYQERARLLTALSEIMLQSCGNLHVLVTSRRETDIEEVLLPLLTCPAISVQGTGLDLDIKTYISWQLATDVKLKKWPNNIRTEIEGCLIAGANGMFRWVDCQLDVLRRCLKPSLILAALKNLPKTLDDTYARIFSSIDEVYREEARNALMWLAFAERPLELRELAEATVIRSDQPFNPDERFPDPRNVLEILSSLVTVNGFDANIASIDQGESISQPTSLQPTSLTTVTLAHYSVKEYLISDRIKNSSAKYLSISDAISNFHLSKCSLHYILHSSNSRSKSSFNQSVQMYPLLRYAAGYWYTHMRSTNYENQKALTTLALELLLSDIKTSTWLLFYRPHTFEINKEEIGYSNSKETKMLSALFYASDMGLLPVVQELLHRGADPNAADENGETPLHRAVIGGYEDVVLLLLEAGANINFKDISGLTPLQYAVKETLGGNSAIVDLLLANGADVNTADFNGWTALHLSAVHGFKQIMKVLLENGAEVDARNCVDQTPLHWAAWSGNEDLIDLLLAKGADINAQNGNGETALHYAARFSIRIMRYLLEKGASPDIQTNRGQTPIQWAITSRRKDAMRYLARAGTTVDGLLNAAVVDGEEFAIDTLSLGSTADHCGDDSL